MKDKLIKIFKDEVSDIIRRISANINKQERLLKVVNKLKDKNRSTLEVLEAETKYERACNQATFLSGYRAALQFAIIIVTREFKSIILDEQPDEIVRKQVSITNGELEVLEDWEELPDNTYEDAVVNGIIKQVKEK